MGKTTKILPLDNELPTDYAEFAFSPGKHNNIKIAAIKEFAPRFAQGAEIVYVRDSVKKDLHINVEELKKLGIPVDENNMLPDIVLYDKKREWLFLIVVATAHGPISPKRRMELEDFLKNCKAHKIYVTAFPDFKECQKYVEEIAWETVVWIAEKGSSEHLIHFNGDRFVGPR